MSKEKGRTELLLEAGTHGMFMCITCLPQGSLACLPGCAYYVIVTCVSKQLSMTVTPQHSSSLLMGMPHVFLVSLENFLLPCD